VKKSYVYPATYEYEDNGTISVYFPDIDNCFSVGESIEECLRNAKECLELYVETELEEGKTLPEPSQYDEIAGNKFLVIADIENMKKQNKAVNKTVTLPHWLNVAAEKEHINFSGVLQEALKERLANSGNLR
jgi:predicted RNase H-like HicB family nuclease